MKNPRVSFVCGAIMFTLIAVGYLLGYSSYTEHTQKLNNLELQNQFISTKTLSLHKNLIILNSALEGLKTANRRERKEILSKIEGITGEIQNWRNEYNTFLNSIKESIVNLTNVDYSIKESIDNLTNVDLGKVEIEGEGR